MLKSKIFTVQKTAAPKTEKGAGPFGPAPFYKSIDDLACAAYRRRYLVEAGADVVTQQTQGADQNNSDKCCDQTILDCGRARFVFADFV
jgi:hypothetical protein